jgi:hypothetical protein
MMRWYLLIGELSFALVPVAGASDMKLMRGYNLLYQRFALSSQCSASMLSQYSSRMHSRAEKNNDIEN